MSDDRRRLLYDSSDLSEPSTSSLIAERLPPLHRSPAHHRPGYTRLASKSGLEEQQTRDMPQVKEAEGIRDTVHTPSLSHGLGVGMASELSEVRKLPVQAIPTVNTKSPPTPGSTNQWLSPPSSSYHMSGLDTTFEEEIMESLPREIANHPRSSSISLSQSTFQPPYDGPDGARLHLKKSAATSIRSPYEDPFHPAEECATKGSVHRGRANWLTIVLLLMSIYSIVFSGVFLIIAFKRTRYWFIRPKGSISPSNASFGTAIIAKSIELSFVTVYVAFLGQVLSRKAFGKKSKGVTLAEMSMRSWIMQPGTILTHWEAVRYGAFSFLGLMSLSAAVMAMLYTSASDALVAPQLKFTPWEPRIMQGPVKTIFANPNYVAEQCITPIRNYKYSWSVCLQMQWATKSYRDFQHYLLFWTDASMEDPRNSTKDLKSRPGGYSLLHENTSVTGSWIDVVDVAYASLQAQGRIINNVSLAMPHPGIIQAAQDPRNGIMQPEDPSGLGTYYMKASIPAPVLRVLCANMDAEELAPLVYETWPDAKPIVDPYRWMHDVDFGDLNNYKIKTNVDDIFGWGVQYRQTPPVFPKYPLEYNTILNDTFDYGRDSIYLLGKGGPDQGDTYVLCSLKSTLTPYCSTEYNATSTGGTLTARCEDPPDEMAYIHSVSNAFGNDHVSFDMPNIVGEWANSISLNAGFNDANASNALFLMQLVLQDAELNPALPSVAEALAVMGGCMLLEAARDSPFVGFWFASGGVFEYQRGFYVVLFFVFVTNVFVFIYLVTQNGLITDFSEPQNLFSLAFNSPPTHLLAGSCGRGPQGDQYRVNWNVNMEGEHLFMAGQEPPRFRGGAESMAKGIELVERPISRMYSKLSKRRSRL